MGIIKRFTILIVLILVGCNTNNPVVQLLESKKDVVSHEEIIHINNCGGTADSEQTIERSFATQIEGEIGLQAGYQSLVEGSISSKYGQYTNLSKKIKLVAPPGTNMEFILRWSEEERAGNVMVNGQQVGDYTVIIPISVEQVSSRDLKCVEEAQNIPSPTTTVLPPSPTITPQYTKTSTPEASLEDFCPPIGSGEAIFSIPLEEMGTPITVRVGSGIFEHAVRPFGTQPTSYRYVKDALYAHPCVQYLTPSVLMNPNDTRHCITSLYHTNRIWVGSVLRGTSVLIRKKGSSSYENIGKIDVVAPDARSYLVEYEIYPGDEICIEAPSGQVLAHIIQAGGYHLWIGRDLKIYTDSWCLMLENDNTMHWCQ